MRAKKKFELLEFFKVENEVSLIARISFIPGKFFPYTPWLKIILGMLTFNS